MGFRRGSGNTLKDFDLVLTGKGTIPFSDRTFGSDFGGSLRNN
jgi:hypothetical protein